MNKIKKSISILLIALLLIGRVGLPAVVLAEDAPPTDTSSQNTTPQTPSAPSAPTAPTAPSAPTPPPSSTQQQPQAPTAPTAPAAPQAPSNNNQNSTGPNTRGSERPINNTTSNTGSTTGSSASGNVGDSTVNTGEGNNNTTVTTTGNNNLAGSGSGSGGASVVNSGNGSWSDNNSSAGISSNNNTSQSNSASVNNNINQSTVTGHNDASFNVGDSSINTGNANSTGTVVTAVNTNVDGVAVAEFNIADDHMGDIILDFNAACVAGCNGNSISAGNSGNGAFSYNNANANSTTNNTTNQTNGASVNNGITLNADSGYNDASFNTGGNSDIITGDANVSASAITFANNNFAGDVIYGVVNIFGNLVGDIILTEEMMNAICGGTCGSATSVANTDNGAWSDNTANTSSTTNNNTFQSNEADINNTLVLDAQTGNNSTSYNTGGSSYIETGSASIDANVLNIANMNIAGGLYWLVIVNEAGNWIGKLMGSPDGSNVAASPLMQFLVDPISGAVTATNSGNGAGSDNQANTSSTTTNNINQTNNAVINNQLNLSANTGGNNSSLNTGGSSNIITGDANIVANIVNFVNTNVTGNGKLVVTVVNVFGSWLGDFITPGQQKTATTGTGGVSNENSEQAKTGSQNSTAASNSGDSVSIQSVILSGSTSGESGAQRTLKFFAGTFGIKNLSENKVLSATNHNKAAEETGEVTLNLAYLILATPFALAIFMLRKKLTQIRVERTDNV